MGVFSYYCFATSLTGSTTLVVSALVESTLTSTAVESTTTAVESVTTVSTFPSDSLCLQDANVKAATANIDKITFFIKICFSLLFIDN